MPISEIIKKLELLAYLTESSIKESGRSMELVSMDIEDAKAMREAISILDGVQHISNLMNHKEPES